MDERYDGEPLPPAHPVPGGPPCIVDGDRVLQPQTEELPAPIWAGVTLLVVTIVGVALAAAVAVVFGRLS